MGAILSDGPACVRAPRVIDGRPHRVSRERRNGRKSALFASLACLDDIRGTLQEVEPRAKADEQLYAEGLDQIETLNDSRRMRLVAAEEVGGVAAVGFTY
jgi:hypothetical protein